jgi:hypothetical protein
MVLGSLVKDQSRLILVPPFVPPRVGWIIIPSLYLITVFPNAYTNIKGILHMYEYCSAG